MPDVLAEHLTYLRLRGRSDLYRQALEAVVSEGDTVADLGCGIGVLGLLALEAGAGEVWGIDSSDAIHLARETMHRAGFSDRYHCLAGSTFRTQLLARVDVLVCDHVGFFGFDYGLLPMIDDARQRLLKPGGQIVPQSLDLWVGAVASKQTEKILGAWTDKSIPEPYKWLDMHQRNKFHSVNLDAADLVGEPRKLASLPLDRDLESTLHFEARIAVEEASHIEGFAGWFDCHLAAGVNMTNAPNSPDNIRRGQAFLPLDRPLEAPAGSAIMFTLRAEADCSHITWSAQPDWGEPRQTMSTFKSVLRGPPDTHRRECGMPALSQLGEATALVLSLADGTIPGDAIAAKTREKFPSLLPTEFSAMDFVRKTLERFS